MSKYKVGDRVALRNFGFDSYATITHVLDNGDYYVEWDDGWTYEHNAGPDIWSDYDFDGDWTNK